MTKNYWKYIIMTLLGLVATFHIGAVIYIIDEDYELTSKDYYEQELDHEGMIERVRAGKSYKWDLRLTTEGLQLKVADAAGQSVALEDVTLHLYKPNESESDKKLRLKPNADGNYVTPTSLAKGLWHARVEAKSGGNAVAYRTSLAL